MDTIDSTLPRLITDVLTRVHPSDRETLVKYLQLVRDERDGFKEGYRQMQETYVGLKAQVQQAQKVLEGVING